MEDCLRIQTIAKLPYCLVMFLWMENILYIIGDSG